MKQKLKRKPQEHKNHIYFFDTLNHSSIKSLKAMLCINVHIYIYGNGNILSKPLSPAVM